MAKCDLTIEIDDNRTTYLPGDQVSGSVVVVTDGDIKCDDLSIELNWATHGKGNTARGSDPSQTLFTGNWSSGVVQRYPFSFTLPDGPVTYHGKYLNVGWFVRARADVPWKIDPKAEAEIALVPDPERVGDWRTQFQDGTLEWEADGEGGEEQRIGPVGLSRGSGGRPNVDIDLGKVTGKLRGSVPGMGCLAVLGLVALGVLGWAGMTAYEGIRLAIDGDWGSALFMLLFPAIPFILLAIGVGFWARHRMVKSRLGEVKVEIDPARVRQGESIRVTTFCVIGKSTALTRATAVLQAQEVVTSGSGTNRTTRTHELLSEEIELCPSRQLQAGMPFQLDVEVQIPAEAPPSFSAHDNRLTWKLTFRFDIPKWPDWTEKREIIVLP